MCSLSVALLAADFAANTGATASTVTSPSSSSSCNNHCNSSNNNDGKEEEIEDDDDNDDESRNNNDNNGLCLHHHCLHRKSTFVEHVFSSMDYASGSSLLVSYGVSKQTLSDAYAGCCALSFYTSSTAMGLSGV